ncbi:MAG: hypothetical protein J5I98_30310 [Phaeodactylibacter sp.]|nr:hypothetical protein [Phaeodactylibacter sp.]
MEEPTPFNQSLTIKKMKQKKPTELTGQELSQEAKKMKSTSITNAVLIGFLMGIVIYSIAKNSWGFFTLIPLFLTYKLIILTHGRFCRLQNPPGQYILASLVLLLTKPRVRQYNNSKT